MRKMIFKRSWVKCVYNSARFHGKPLNRKGSGIPPKIVVKNLCFTLLFTVHDIKEALNINDGDKSPSPDGFINVSQMSFWEDPWCNQGKLRERSLRLYSLAMDKDAIVETSIQQEEECRTMILRWRQRLFLRMGRESTSIPNKELK
ncbi:hypothetical protein VNO77_01796 [Canavalia gladiata]|uniref:Uncharacterized protein n=1 Tax=Canavalia gladiata TaxID=3824 RepID=A0AAN9MTS2_CANGL